MKTICLTGGIASGKSTASAFFREKGAHVIDADKLGHRAYDPGTPGFSKVIEAFGDDIVANDGGIDRKALGARVFGKPEALAQLTNIVWPEIRKLAEAEIEEVRKNDPDAIVVLEAAVLFEAGWEDIGDEIWVLIVDRETAIERAMARDGVERAAIESRIDSQLSNEERASRADVVIENDADEATLIARLEKVWAQLGTRQV
ncbi:MAG: dephospho-CoA kinase [Gammaproteobacteria bacterium]|nr:dephospho-CoA kinase [Gammaproteobacteria bacterium]